jgi:hypothetical protein
MTGNFGDELIFIVALAVMNTVGLVFANYFGTLIFLDTLATAMAGLACRPFAVFSGLIVGLLSNLMIAWNLKYRSYLKFIHVNIFCGLAWGLIAHCLPLKNVNTEQDLIWYILVTGTGVALLSAVLSVPLRILLGFKTDHALDQVSGEIWRKSPGVTGAFKIFWVEYVLSHWVDKTISTTVGVVYVMVLFQQSADPHTSATQNIYLSAIYHDMIELLAACYYVAMAYAIKSFKVTFSPDDAVALLGPLGFFGVLIAMPVLMRAFGMS